ncbi:MAG: radical SAM protein [Candidatus Aminicenantes bacterium]|nr:radical SAM protein [Candidatus Aminicenantes bacterium]
MTFQGIDLITMKESKRRLILHCLPPSIVEMPSPAFSILKSFLAPHGYDAEVIYWNIYLKNLLAPYLSDYYNFKGDFSERDNMDLLPFIYLISERYNDARSRARITAYLERIFPQYMLEPGKYSRVLTEWKNGFYSLIDSVLENRQSDDVILFGFSSKFYQWLPGMFLAEKLKERFPQVKIVLGGFGDKEAARVVLKVCPHYDFAVWGEGEYPLLELSNLLFQGKNDFKNIPRLVFRQGEDLVCTGDKSKYFDFQPNILPDYRDYFDQAKEIDPSIDIFALPIESGRGCHWNKCRFCYLNAGYRYRSRTTESIVNEIETHYKNYGMTGFYFVCNDIVGHDIKSFENLLDRLIELSNIHEVAFTFHGEVVHRRFNSRLIKKIFLAGFDKSQIGYEAITDALLKKINKRTDFADHLLFLKFAQKNGIEPTAANIMRGIVGETEADVFQSIENLPFLRFFMRRKEPGFFHSIQQLRLQGNTGFFHQVDKNDLGPWNYNFLTHLLPGNFIAEEQRFTLFDFTRPLEYQAAWDLFESVNRFYEETEFTYRVLTHGDIRHYYEYREGRVIDHTVFDKPEYWLALKTANHEVVSFEHIWEQIQAAYPQVTREKLTGIIQDLKASHLLYASADLSRIVSIIDTETAG